MTAVLLLAVACAAYSLGRASTHLDRLLQTETLSSAPVCLECHASGVEIFFGLCQCCDEAAHGGSR